MRWSGTVDIVSDTDAVFTVRINGKIFNVVTLTDTASLVPESPLDERVKDVIQQMLDGKKDK